LLSEVSVRRLLKIVNRKAERVKGFETTAVRN
jgi:hypothetical protein